jgi:cytochrome c biogenesis protein CcdA
MPDGAKQLTVVASGVCAVALLADAIFDDHRRWLVWLLFGLVFVFTLGFAVTFALFLAAMPDWAKQLTVAVCEAGAIALIADAIVVHNRRGVVWLLLGLGFVLAFAVSSVRRGSWIEVAGGLVLVLGAFALAKEFAPDARPAGPPASLARVRIPKTTEVRTTTGKRGSAVILLLVDQVRDPEGKTLRFESHRYKAKLVGNGPTTVEIKRGKNDSTLEAFVRDLAGAAIVYIRPAVTTS